MDNLSLDIRSSVILKTELPVTEPDLAPEKTPPDALNEIGGAADWAIWGNNNRQPTEMRTLIDGCGVLNAALDAKARLCLGKGLQPFILRNIDAEGKEELEWVNDNEVHDWLEESELYQHLLDMSYDENAYGWCAGTMVFNRAKTRVNRLRRVDVYDCRLSRRRPESGNIIKELYMADDWGIVHGANDKSIVRLPLALEGREHTTIKQAMDGSRLPPEMAYINRRRRDGRQYYANPLWYSAKQWVKVAAEIPRLKNAMFQNQLTIKYVVTISRSYWEENFPGFSTMPLDKRKAIVSEVHDTVEKALTTTDNQYKTIFTSTSVDPVTKEEVPHIKVETLDDKIKDGKLLPDSSAANSEILFALLVNPALMGAGQPGGPYSNNAGGSNIRESYLTAIMMLEAERKSNSRIMRVVKKINGWNRLETNGRLVWRFPAGVLTTLDTGKSTKSENL